MAESDIKTKALARAELFKGIDEGLLARVAEASALREYEEGDVIYGLGDAAEHVFVLVSGRVRFTLGVGNRGQSSGSIMSGRMVFGWAALIDDHPRRVATAECLEDSVVLAVGGSTLLDELAADPSAGFLVMRRLASMIARNFTDVGSN